MQSDDLKEIIGKTYNLEDHIIDRLEFTYKHKFGNNSKTKVCVISNYEKLISENYYHLFNTMSKV